MTRHHDPGSDGPMNRSLALDPELQAYVEGTLDAKQALRIHLRAQADASLAADIERTRDFFASLDSMPREQPAADFDARVLASVPLELYRSAPRREVPVLVLGDLAPSAWWVALRRAGRGAMAAAVSYCLALVVANSALRGFAETTSAAIAARLDAAVARASSHTVLSALVGGIERAYDAAALATAQVAGAIGPSAFVFVIGGLIGLFALAGLAAHQRRTLDGPRT